MKYFAIIVLFISQLAWGQLTHTVELKEKLNVTSEAEIKHELLHQASMKAIEKFAPEMGYKFDEYSQKLNTAFDNAFEKQTEKKLIEKFGAGYKETLSADDKKNFVDSLQKDRHDAFIKFSRSLDVLRSHSVNGLKQDESDASSWSAKIDVDLDKVKLERQFRKILNGEERPYTKLYIVTEIDPASFSWADMGLETDKSFIQPLNESWVKWFNENLPNTVEEAAVCSGECVNFYNKWTDTHIDQLSMPADFNNTVFLKINMSLKRTSNLESLKEVTFEWEGRSLLQDVNTKRILGSSALGQEKRTFRQLDQKALNSALASSIYRSPMTAFLYFKRKLEEKLGFNRVSKLVIQGHKHLGDLYSYIELLKTRGSSLGLEVFLSSFSKNEAKLTCYYRGEEKSFTDLLSAIKELKSSHSYTLVNDITGNHYTVKFVTE